MLGAGIVTDALLEGRPPQKQVVGVIALFLSVNLAVARGYVSEAGAGIRKRLT